MSDKNQIKLKLTALLNVPLNNYDKDFTFIVNGERFQTSKIVADLLSPRISKMHRNDPTFCEFNITTESKGNFSKFLKIINFQSNEISDEDISFIAEIVSILDNDFLEVAIPTIENENSIEDTLKLVQKHEKCGIFYSKVLNEEIEFISSNFYQITEDDDEEFKKLSIKTIENIIKNNHIQLKSEDQLISIINQLYVNDPSISYLYEYVDFLNVSQEKIVDFINIFDINDITQMMWRTMSERFKQKIIKPSESALKSKIKKIDGIQIQYDKEKVFDGIFNYLTLHSNSSLNSKVSIYSSSCYNNESEYDHRNVCIFDNYKIFRSNNTESSWIKFSFYSDSVIPYHYTIKSSKKIYVNRKQYNKNPKSWVLEGSNDNDHWIILDERTDVEDLCEENVTKTFSIQNWQNEAFKYLRLRQTSKNWNGDNEFVINSVEFYGTLEW